MRPVCLYSVSTTETFFNPGNYKGVQCPISPFTPRQPRDELPFNQGVHWCLTFDETPHQKWTPMMRNISLQLTLMTQYGLNSLCPIAGNTCAFTRYQTSNPSPTTQSIGDAPRAETNGYIRGSRLRQIFWDHENLSGLSIIRLIQLL